MPKINLNNVLRAPANTDEVETNGAFAVLGVLNANAAGLRTKQAVTNVDNTTPTAAELTTAFGAVSGLGRGFIGTVDDADGDTNGFIVWTSDASFYFLKGTKAT
jgi:hypothetical protein